MVSDISFVKIENPRQSPRYFANLLPDLIVEIKSQSDRIQPLENKILQFIALATEIGMLIDSDKETVTIYYCDERQLLVLGADMITIPELLLDSLCPPMFD